MSGDGLVPPLNAPAAGAIATGVQPGTTPGIVLAQFVIVFGTAGGVFVYNGTPGPGNQPIASVTNAPTDPYGDPTQSGFTVYNLPAYLQLHVNAGFGAPAVEMVTGVASEADHAAMYTDPNNVGLVNEIIGTFLIGPGSSFDGLQAAVNLASSAADGSEIAVGTLGMIKSGVFTNWATWDPSGFQTVSPGGGTWQANGTQTDATTHTLGATGSTPTNLTKAWVIPADDANVATVYEVEVPVGGTYENQQLNIGINLGGSFTNVVPVSSSFVTAGHNVAGMIKMKLTVQSTGALGTVDVDFGGTLEDSTAVRSAAGSTGINGRHAALAIDTTSANAFAIAAEWGGTTSGQMLSGFSSVYARCGQ